MHRVIFFKKIKCSISFGHLHQLYIRELINEWFHFGWYNFLEIFLWTPKEVTKMTLKNDKIYSLYTYILFSFFVRFSTKKGLWFFVFRKNWIVEKFLCLSHYDAQISNNGITVMPNIFLMETNCLQTNDLVKKPKNDFW